MVVVALGDPNSPVTCCAMQEDEGSAKASGAKRYRDNVLDCVHTKVFPFDSVLSAANSQPLTGGPPHLAGPLGIRSR